MLTNFFKKNPHTLKSENSRSWRRWFLPIVFLLVGGVLYSLLIFFKPEPPLIQSKTKIWPVNVMRVKLQSHAPVLTVYGVVENPGVLKITTPGSSYVTQLPVSEGQIVKQGDLLVQLDQRDFLPKVQSAEAAVFSAQAELSSLKLRHTMDASTHQTEIKVLELKKLQLSRTELLKQKQLGSQAAVDQADQAYHQQKLAVAQREFTMDEYPHKIKQLQAQLTQAKVEHELARLQLERSRIVASSTSIVGRVDVAEGDRVEGNQRLFSVYPFQTMNVRAKIPAPYVAAVVSALADDSGKAQQLSARVDGQDIELTLRSLAGEADTRGIDALFIAKSNANRLRKGMALTIYLNLPDYTRSVAIPYEALYGVDRAYKVVNDTMQGVEITRLGDTQGPDGVLWALIQSDALSDNDWLVTTHLPNAVNGLIVEPRQQQP